MTTKSRRCRSRRTRGRLRRWRRRGRVDAQLVGEQADHLDAADDQRDCDRERGDGDVVVDLANRLRERPAVGEVHERPVEGVEQRHAGGEEDRQGEHRPPRQARGDRAAGDHQQADLGDGVEAEAEQEAHRVHVPRLGDRLGDLAQDPVEEAALVELALELGLVVPAVPQLAEDLHDADQRSEVDQPDEQQEGAADRGAPHAGDLLQRGVVVVDAAGERAHAERDRRAPSRRPPSEWPRLNQKPTLIGRLPSAISLRVVLSIAAMWSASKACRMPRVYAVTPRPTPRTLPPTS